MPVPAPRPLSERLLENSEPQPNGCRLWKLSRSGKGYGKIRVSTPVRALREAHRVAFEEWVRPLEPGEVVDHLCHNEDESCAGGVTCLHRRCVQPEHLAAKTQGENIRAGRSPSAINVGKTHCPSGHEYTEANTYRWRNKRQCVLCREVHTTNANEKKRTIKVAAGRS